MNTSLFEFTPVIAALVPIAIALVQLAKEAGLPGKFAPLLAIAVGVGLSMADGISMPADLTQGLLVGLAASGLFSGSKALLPQKPSA